MAQQTNIKNSNLRGSAKSESHSRITSVIKTMNGFVAAFMKHPVQKGEWCLRLRACSYGEKLSRLARKHFDLPNNFVLFIWDEFPLSGKVLNQFHSYTTNIFPCTEISPINKRDLGTWENFSSHMNVR